MYRVKIFIGWNIYKTENEINKWLLEHEPIEVKSIKQDIIPGSGLEGAKVIITICYKIQGV